MQSRNGSKRRGPIQDLDVAAVHQKADISYQVYFDGWDLDVSHHVAPGEIPSESEVVRGGVSSM